jgi:hypothetical protein
MPNGFSLTALIRNDIGNRSTCTADRKTPCDKEDLKMKALLTLALLCAANVQGQILIYKMSVHSTVTGHGFTTKRITPGYLVVDTATGAAAEFDLDPRAKDYSFRSKEFTVSTVHGGGGKNYMVFAEAGADTDASGRPFKFSSTVKGAAVSLNVGLADNRLVPRTMRFIGAYIFYIGSEPFMEEATDTLVIDLPGTQSANSAGHTFEDVLTTIRSKLADRGYTDNHP